MKKLIKGVVEFGEKLTPEKKKHFASLALEQKPDALLIGCSDSRVVPNLFASTNPGDVFVIRNLGNTVPSSCSTHSESAAIDFAMLNLAVKDIVICGHSECGAIHALYNSEKNPPFPSLSAWLENAKSSLESFKNKSLPNDHLSPENQLSQVHVLEQVKHVLDYPNVKERFEKGSLRIHAWWFDIANAQIFMYEKAENNFVLLNAQKAEELLKNFT